MKIFLSVLAVTAAVVLLGCVSVFAVDSEVFGYLLGRQRSASRADLYAEAEALPKDQQDEFLAENGVGEEPYSEEAAADYGFVTGQANGSQFENADQDGDYSYLAGSKNSAARNDLYAEAEALPEDQQDEFLAENGVGEEAYSEEAAAGYAYHAGQQRGASYRQGGDAERAQDTSGYGYVAGMQRGASYRE